MCTQLVKNPPAMQETPLRFLGWTIPRRRVWQPTPVSLPGESHGQRSPAGYSPRGSRRVRHAWVTKHTVCTICQVVLGVFFFFAINPFNPHNNSMRKAPSLSYLRKPRNREINLPQIVCIWKSLSHVQLFVTPWTIQSMEFSRPEYWSG